MRKHIFTLLLALMALTVTAQIQTPAPSPKAKLETVVGLTDVHVEYSRPGVKGRTIFAADGLVPYGEVWRTGANQATKITFGDDVMVAGTEVPAGSYAVLSKPAADQWEVMFYTYETGNWGSYLEKDPAATVMAKVSNMADAKVENFTIMIDEYTMDGANMYMMWDNTMAMLPIKTNAKEDIKESIERVMAGPSMNDYYNAASFLSDSGDDERALEYITKANGMDADNPRYWMMRRQAIIQEKMGMKDEAKQSYEKSMMLAEKAGNKDYVRMNKKSLDMMK